MIALPYLSAICFSGADAGDFLHNQVSSDVLALSSGESVFACYCEPKGRVLALMLVSKVGNDYFVILSQALADSIARRLKMYVMRSQVDTEVLTEKVVAVLFEDNSSDHEVSSTIVIPLPGSGQQLAIISRAKAPGHDTKLSDGWRTSELQRGVCWLSTETSGQFLPQMLGFDQLGAVNFRKGCYPGQEIVARTHYLGKVKRHPRLLNCKPTVCPGLMDKISLIGDDQSYDAIVVDCQSGEDGDTSLMVVTRMEPELLARQIEYQGNAVDVI
ncbi:MAG: hypothetical protein OEU84_01635 [Xanthomonadales bacterium]|nr:hypothetical protein [Xanthomonadales bacterium]